MRPGYTFAWKPNDVQGVVKRRALHRSVEKEICMMVSIVCARRVMGLVEHGAERCSTKMGSTAP
jgi:hypothetical protein